MVLEPIFEADFLDCSYGFRPKRNAQQAHAEIKKTINAGHHWVVDGDIEKYFDSIPHEKLMKLVELRVSDRRVLRLVRGWLKAGIWKDGQVTGSRLGTPQGGVISPLLSNIYLHYFDRLWHKHHAKLGKLVRYADDFVILCQGEKEADQCLAALGSLLQRFDLKLHPLKTRKVDMSQGKEGFDVLGFHFHRTPSFRNPARRYCLSWPSKAAMKKVSESITAQTSCLYPRSLDEVAESLNRIIRGWTNYFKVGNSNRKFYILDQHVQRRLHRFCCKKFQHVTWAKTALRIRGMNLLSAAKVAPGWRLSHAAGL
jgi:group II intron reverse transcriptase/maturase